MAYEHEKEKDAIVDAGLDAVKRMVDGFQPEDIVPIISDVTIISANVKVVLEKEPKRIARIKFAIKVVIGLLNKAIDLLIPDEA